jgi:ArsR family transcriptional regulator
MGGLQCNCTIKESFGLPMNLISHHLKLLKEAGLVRAERDPSDARWIYYEIDPRAMATLRDALFAALDPSRLRPRADCCGPTGCCPPAKPRKETSTRRTR